MPTYEYNCAKCGRFEEFQSITAPALDKCPTCGGPVTRLISAGSGMIFKGSGFYTTDYRKPDYAKRQKEDSASPAKTEAPKPSSPATGNSAPKPGPTQTGGGESK